MTNSDNIKYKTQLKVAKTAAPSVTISLPFCLFVVLNKTITKYYYLILTTYCYLCSLNGIYHTFI